MGLVKNVFFFKTAQVFIGPSSGRPGQSHGPLNLPALIILLVLLEAHRLFACLDHPPV